MKRRRWTPRWPSGCDPRLRQSWQPSIAQVADGLDWFKTKMLPSFSIVEDTEELDAMRAMTSAMLADEDMYLTTALGIGDIISLNVYGAQRSACEWCAKNVGLLVVRVAEREGIISIIDRADSPGPGQPFSLVAPVGGVVAPRSRPIIDHGAWFAHHTEGDAVPSALVCENCMFVPTRSA
jgi:hypothetical protein